MDNYLQGWLDKAENDLKVAGNELSFPEVVTEAVCFHSQQAAEKFLKAYLISRGTEFGKTHNLEFLLELCGKSDPDFKQLEAGDLSFYAVQVRYPDDFYRPTPGEARESLRLAQAIGDFVKKRLA